MDKRDKVISGFTCLLSWTTPNDCSECGYECNTAIHVKTPVSMIFDAIVLLKEDERAIKFQSDRLDALLKAQEPVEPIENAGFYYCGACKYAFTSARQKYCSDCGRSVKWQ